MALNTNIGPERVQVIDVPLGTVQVPGISQSVTAFLISTSQVGAPVNSVVSVTDLSEFEDTFGGADEVGEAYYAVQGFYDNAGTGAVALIVNVGASATAADYIGSASDGSGLRALDAQDVLGLVCIPGLPLEEAYLVHPALIDYTETVRAEFGSTLSTSFSICSMPSEVATAEKDVTVTAGQVISISGAGPYVIDIQLESGASAASGTVTISDFSLMSADTVSVGGVDLVEGVDFTAAVSNDDTAASLASAIDALPSVSAVAVGAVVTITASAVGEAGNSISLSYTDSGSGVAASVSGATLLGGADGNVDLSSVTAGMIIKNDAQDFQATITSVDDVADTITVSTDPSSAFSPGDDVTVYIPSAVTYKELVVNNPSRTAAWYFNNVLVDDRSSSASPGDIIQVDPSGHVAGVMARIDANTTIGGVSHAAAGIQYAGLAGIKGLALSLSERVDAAPLRLAFINRLTSFPGAGNIIFGAYTADSGTSPLYTADEQLSQVMRTLQYIKASIERGLRAFIWENFSPDTQSQVERAIESFLRNNSYLFPAGLPEAQQFQVLRVEPTQDELDIGLLKVRVLIRPNKAVRFIEVSLEFPLPAA